MRVSGAPVLRCAVRDAAFMILNSSPHHFEAKITRQPKIVGAA